MINKSIKYIKYLIPEDYKRIYRKYHRRINKGNRKRISLEELKDILVNNLGLQAEDTVIVHSSFGNLFGDFSPTQVINLIMEIVTESGNILMPFYPSGHAYHWIQKEEEFDVKKSRSCMGVLTETFKNFKEVKLSPHPVKAMAGWGKDRDTLISDHHKSIYPYDEYSPYYRTVLMPKSKTIGLGVEINSFIHCCEDLFLKDKWEIYSDRNFQGKVKYYDRTIEVNTYLHEPKKVNGLVSGCTFLKATNFPGYNFFSKEGILFFSTDNKEVMKHSKSYFSKGITRNPHTLRKI